MKYDHIYRWGNNPKRAKYKGRACRILCHGAKQSVLIEFENGERTVTSMRAIAVSDLRQLHLL